MKVYYIHVLGINAVYHDKVFTTLALAKEYASEWENVKYTVLGFVDDKTGERVAELRTATLQVD